MDAGTLVDGRFEILRRAAAGGMGAVYHARDRLTGGHAAVKVVRTLGVDNVERLFREGRSLAQLDHPHVVRYLSHGTTAEGDAFLAMEWVEGETLSRRLARAPMSIRDSLTLLLCIAEALGHAHAKGIVHRDVKPQNIILRSDDPGSAVLVDFGVARASRDNPLTMTGMIVGTPAYMAPEQARGARAIEPSADVFALGCLLYRCATGRNAFEAEDQVAVLAKVLLDDPPPLGAILAGVDPALDAFARRLLAKEPERRPANGLAAAEELRALAASVKDGPPSSMAPVERLTLTERRLVSLVIAPAPDDPEATVSGDDPRAGLSPIRAVAARHGAVCEVLANGTLVVALVGRGSATDQVGQAAHIALELKEELPGAPLVLVTGRAVVDGGGDLSTASGITRRGSADVFEHGARLMAALSREKSAQCVVIDETTAGLLERAFIVGPHALGLELRGLREGSGDTARLLGKVTACVGRDRELATLDALLAECASEPVARAALVTAAPGMGKSRLVRELVERVAGRVQVLRATCDAFAGGSPLSMLAQIVRGAAGVEAADTLEARVRKLRARVARHVPRGEVEHTAEFLGEASGIPQESARVLAARADPRLMSQHVHDAWTQWLAAECGANTVLMIVDDVQWSDVLSARLLQDALSELVDSPLCILVVGRPEAGGTLPEGLKERAIPIPLGALSKKASERLVREALPEAPDAVVARMVARAGGQPLLLEELVRAWAEGDEGTSEIAAVAMVQSRLETLDAESRRVLRAASVFGETFWRGGVEHLLSASVGAQLDAVEAKELVAKRASSRIAGEHELAFRHALVRDAAYEMLTPEDAALGHRLAAEWLATKPDIDPSVLAEHLSRSDRPDLAVPHLVRAAEAALEAGDFGGVLERVARARAIGPPAGVEGALLYLEAEAFRWTGESARAEASAMEALERLPAASAPWLHAARVAAFAAGLLGRLDRLLELARRLLDVHPIGAAAERAWSLAANQAVTQLLIASPHPVAFELLERTHGATPEMLEGDPVLAMHHFHARSTAAFRRGDYERVLEAAKASVEAAHAAGDVRFAALQGTNVGFALAQLGDFEAALEQFRASRAEAESRSLGPAVATLDQNIGYTLLCMGRLDEALAVEERVAAETGESSPRLHALARACLARIHVRRSEAAEAVRDAKVAAGSSPEGAPRIYALACLAEAELAAGEAEAALRSATEAWETVERLGGAHIGDVVAGRVRVEALAALGRDDEARRALEGLVALVRARVELVASAERRAAMADRVEDHRRVLELAAELLPARMVGA